MTEVQVRELEPRDREQVGRLLRATYDATGPFDDEYRDFLLETDAWASGATAVFVAEIDERPVGVVAFVTAGDEQFETAADEPVADCGFRFLAVVPEAQGHGAGRALVHRIIEEGRRQGCRRMVIHSMAFMTAAHALYEAEGFVRRPDLDVTFPTGRGFAFQFDLADDAGEHFPPPGDVRAEPPWYEDVWT